MFMTASICPIWMSRFIVKRWSAAAPMIVVSAASATLRSSESVKFTSLAAATQAALILLIMVFSLRAMIAPRKANRLASLQNAGENVKADPEDSHPLFLLRKPLGWHYRLLRTYSIQSPFSP